MQKSSASRIKWLKGEIEGWITEGLIGPDVGERLIQRYKKAGEESGRSRLIIILGTLAVLLLGVGVVLFFASNWEQMSRFTKLAVICVALAGSYLAAYELKYRRDYAIIGEAVTLLGTLLFGAGIYLTAQAFHLSAHFPNGVLLWMLGIIPMAMLVRSKPILFEATLLLGVWIIWESVVAFDMRTYDVLILRCMIGTGLLIGFVRLIYKFGGEANAFLIVPTLATLLTIFLMAMSRGSDDIKSGHMMAMYLALSLVSGAVGAIHSRNDGLPPFAGVYRFFALIPSASIIYMLTFGDIVEEMTGNVTWFPPVMAAVLFMIIAVALMVSVLNKAGAEAREELGELYIYLALCGFCLLLLFLSTSPGTIVAISALANLVLFGFALALIFVGSRTGRAGLINFGILVLAADFITRYFDWFFTLMDRALFFIVLGLILLAGGIFLEKRRRRWLAEAREVEK